MSKAADFARTLSSALMQRPAFSVQGPNGPVIIAYVDIIAGTSNGSTQPCLVIEKCALSHEQFADLVGWAADNFNEEAK